VEKGAKLPIRHVHYRCQSAKTDIVNGNPAFPIGERSVSKSNNEDHVFEVAIIYEVPKQPSQVVSM
jgi:hypothetical protein